MEQIGMERLDAMKAYLQGTPDALVWDAFVEGRLNAIRTKFAEAVDASVKKLAGQRTDGVIAISYLRSSIVTGSHEFYIAYYIGEPFVEEEPEGMYLDLHHIFEDVEADCAEIIRILGRKFVRMLDSEKEEIRRWYLCQLYEQLGTGSVPWAEETQAAVKIPVLYGGYMERLHRVGETDSSN